MTKTKDSLADRLRDLAEGTMTISEDGSYYDGVVYYDADEVKPALLAVADCIAEMEFQLSGETRLVVPGDDWRSISKRKLAKLDEVLK